MELDSNLDFNGHKAENFKSDLIAGNIWRGNVSNETEQVQLSTGQNGFGPPPPNDIVTADGLVMLGISDTQPKLPIIRTGTAMFQITGTVSADIAAASFTLCLRVGNGVAPEHGDAGGAGTNVSPTQTIIRVSAGDRIPFCISGIGTGLLNGDSYWSDIEAEVLSALTTLSFFDINVMQWEVA